MAVGLAGKGGVPWWRGPLTFPLERCFCCDGSAGLTSLEGTCLTGNPTAASKLIKCDLEEQQWSESCGQARTGRAPWSAGAGRCPVTGLQGSPLGVIPKVHTRGRQKGAFPVLHWGGSPKCALEEAGKDLPWDPHSGVPQVHPRWQQRRVFAFYALPWGGLSKVQDGRRLLGDNRPVFFKR